jgi:hypothetical protein
MTKPATDAKGLILWPALLFALTLPGCGLLGSGASPSSHRPGATSAAVAGSRPPAADAKQSSGVHAPAPRALRPVAPAAPGSAAAVLYRYAWLYGNLCSCSRAATRLDALAGLAAPALAAQLRQLARSARRAVAGGLPEPARAMATVENLELAPNAARPDTGLVVLLERTIARDGVATGSQPVVYTARLERTAAGWRVVAFAPVRSHR